MPHLVLPGGARIHFREHGAGPAVLLLHGGWGAEAYPFDRAVLALAPSRRVVVPDRTGFGGSGRLRDLARGFHRRMAEETLSAMDALGLDRAALWGHSDGAVVAAWAAMLAPERVPALVLEALHFLRAKPASIEFFRTGAEAPERYGDAIVRALAKDHGDSWREVIAMESRAWLSIIEEGLTGGGDLFDGGLGRVRAPTLLLHGRRDPRTEPGELDAALRALGRAPRARCELLDCGHSPHTSATAAARSVELAAGFLAVHHPR